MVKLTNTMDFKYKEGLSKDASIPQIRGNKIIRGGRGSQ